MKLTVKDIQAKAITEETLKAYKEVARDSHKGIMKLLADKTIHGFVPGRDAEPLSLVPVCDKSGKVLKFWNKDGFWYGEGTEVAYDNLNEATVEAGKAMLRSEPEEEEEEDEDSPVVVLMSVMLIF